MKESGAMSTEIAPTKLRSTKRLLALAIFFAGYASSISVVSLEDLAESFGVGRQAGAAQRPTAAIGLGSILALALCRLADKKGRRQVFLWSMVASSVFTGLTALAGSITVFTLLQLAARAFLATQFILAVTVLVEEFPPQRRGGAVGSVMAWGALGLPAAAGLHWALAGSSLGWRALYVVGLAPLILAAVMRNRLQETRRWLELGGKSHGLKRRVDLLPMVQSGAAFFLTSFAVFAAAGWWSFYAETERHFSDSTMTLMLAVAYPSGVLGYFVSGWLQDSWGRRKTGTLFMPAATVSGIAAFQATTPGVMLGPLVLATFFGFGLTPLLSTLVAEAFPTGARAYALGLARSVFGTLGAILGPVVVGIVTEAGKARGLTGMSDFGDGVSLAALALIPALFILRSLPETGGRELENIAQVASAERFELFHP